MKCTLLAFIACAIAYVNAAAISVPNAATSWKLGTKQTVQWIDSNDFKNEGPADLLLYYVVGDKKLNTKPPIHTFKIPELKNHKVEIDLSLVDGSKLPPSSNNYFFVIGNASSPAAGSFSSAFTITGGSGPAEVAGATSGATGGMGGTGATGATGATGGIGGTGATGGIGGTGATGGIGGTGAGIPGSNPLGGTTTKTTTKSITTTKTSDAATTYTFSLLAVLAAFIAVFI